MDKGLDRKLVSVIIPAYKCEQYITACIDSIFRQTYRHIEIIVVYVLSPDKTLSILEKYGKDIILVKQKRKINPATARNVGLKIAKGEYVAFCDADDFFGTQKIENQIKVIENSEADFTYTDLVVVDEKGDTMERKIYPEIREDTINSWMASPFTAISSILVKKELLNRAGNFDESLDMVEDMDLEMRLIAFSKIIKKTPGFLTFYRVHSGSLSTSLWFLRDLNRIRIFKKYGLGKQVLLELLRRLFPDLIIFLLRRPQEITQGVLHFMQSRR